jgi:hypothetical protein
LVAFAITRLSKPPSALTISDLDALLIAIFATRNAATPRAHSQRAIRGDSGAVSLRGARPSRAGGRDRPCLGSSLEARRETTRDYLSDTEGEAILAAPDRTTWTGRRDHTWVA